MTRHRQPSGVPRRFAAGLGAATVLWLACAAAGQQPDARFQAQLAAGEFAPAMAGARNAATPEEHDALLARIAAAQARAGARNAALRTAGEIYDDRARSDAIGRVAGAPPGGRGGAPGGDFDSLMELVTTTVQPQSWEDVGGVGSIAPFPTGVFVDAEGTLKPLLKRDEAGRLAALHAARETWRPRAGVWTTPAVRRSTPLRMVSLPRLERQVQLRLAAGQQPTEAMQTLAGLQRIEHLFVYPKEGDLVVAGPAGDWQRNAENRIVSTDTGLPVVRLDDLVVVLRHAMSSRNAQFGCAIAPRQEALARVQAFLKESGKRSVSANRRSAWLEELRSTLGKQEIEVYALDPRTRAARVLVEADYRMKLVGMGIEEGVPGVTSYLDTVADRPGGPPPMGVLRWWFTLNYDAVEASPDRRAFEIRGQGVKVLSENELLTAQGKRVHTGQSDELNRRFAHNFTEHFDALARKYPVYADLRNVFDLALVSALIEAEGLADQVGWHMTCFGDPAAYRVGLAPAPTQVDTVVNHRVIRRDMFIAGVSGGVSVDPMPLVSAGAIRVDQSGRLSRRREEGKPDKPPLEAWWWE